MARRATMKLYNIRRVGPREYEFSIGDWKLRGVKHRLRVGIMNTTEVFVDMPGLGGHFRLSYSPQFSIPLRGAGIAIIRKRIANSQNRMGDFRRAPLMLEQTAQGIYDIIKKLRQQI